MKPVFPFKNAIKYLAILFIFNLLVVSKNYAQDLSNVNAQLRHIFKHLTYPNNDVLFLYDRSAKVTHESFYTNFGVDTLDNTVWLQLYNEMFFAAHDTTSFIKKDSIEYYSYQYFGDTIPIGIMDYDYYACKYEALNSGDYFIFDTINNFLYNKPNPIGNPYELKNIFAATPLKPIANYLNPVFTISPDFLFTDSNNEFYYTSTTQGQPYVRIDFGDNTGWHHFDLTQTSFYQAQYDTNGQQVITVELYSKKKGFENTIKKSKSNFNILKKTIPVLPNDVWDMEGMNVGIFYGCETNPENEKVIIYLEGWDMLDLFPGLNRGIDAIYTEMIEGYTINELRNFNYTYYVVDWKNSRTDIRFNALHLLNLIERLKEVHKQSVEQFVIIGESMGGLVARYALTYMESPYYQNADFSPFFQDQYTPENIIYLLGHNYLYNLGNKYRNNELVSQSHKTREFITLDTPHQGANVPLSVQHFYRKALGFLPAGKVISTALNFGLEGYAAKQMLIYHIDGKHNPLSHTSSYGPHIANPIFFRQLNSLGDYPKYCKKVALTNGTLSGKNQLNVFGEPRTPNDVLLESNSRLYARIFYIKVPIFGYDFRLKTNPSGSATFYTASFGNFTLNIKLKWFGINIDNSYSNIYSDNQIAVNTKSYDVSAGGYMNVSSIENGITGNQGSSYNLSDNWWLDIFGYNLYSDQNCLKLNSHIGWNGFASVNLDFKTCTDGTKFSFVPLQSAIDYGKDMNIPLNHNILNEDINVKLSRTPFDVIIGYPDNPNRYHLNYRDEYIYNTTHSPALNCTGIIDPYNKYTFFEPDQSFICGNKRGILTLEIGDEELYLENWSLNRKSSFQAQYDLHINERNPYYEYPSYEPSDFFDKEGIYSKDKNFEIIGNGFATFYSDYLNSPTGIGFSYTYPQENIYWNSVNLTEETCWNVLQGRPAQSNQDIKSDNENKIDLMLIYPNPSRGINFTVDVKSELSGESLIEIYNMMGKIVYSERFNVTTNRALFNISSENLNSGIYLLRFSNIKYTDSQRIIID